LGNPFGYAFGTLRRLALRYASCLRRETLLQHWSHRLQDFSPPYDLWSNQANHSLLLPRCISLSIGFSVCYGHQNLCYFTLSLYKIVHFADLLGKNMTSDLK
jgi:hypothetical protein